VGKEQRKETTQTETKMKLAWKSNNKNSKKRSLSAISKFPNLPFENQQDQHEDEANRSSNTQVDKRENGDEGSGSLESSDSSDAKQLAQSFQAQGNKLAEVSPDFWSPSLLPFSFSSLVFSVRHVIISQFGEPSYPNQTNKKEKKKPNLD
jgi:hypothetical protein